MSYEIYYDRAFIRVGDKFVPLVNSGSNNCFEVGWAGREIPEKNWSVLNWKRRSQLLFTEQEIYELAEDYETISRESGTCFKTRYRSFESDEFRRWIVNGMKNAYTIEEYISYGNKLYILDYSGEYGKWPTYPFQTTDEFLELQEKLKDCRLLCVKFENNREVYRPKRPKNYNTIDKKAGSYFVLVSEAAEQLLYFCRLRKRSIYYSAQMENNAVRAFSSEAEARRYMKKYEKLFANQDIKIHKVLKQPDAAA